MPPTRASDLSFERLIHPVTVDAFLREYWEQQPLVIARGQPDFYSELLSAADIDSIVGFRQLKYSQLKVAKSEADSQANKVFYVDGGSTSDTNQLFHSYDQGDTLVLNFVQCYWEPAARVSLRAGKLFSFSGGDQRVRDPAEVPGISPAFRCARRFRPPGRRLEAVANLRPPRGLRGRNAGRQADSQGTSGRSESGSPFECR